ncbi:two-component system, NtrC family, response regulator PilR/two-component system, response regulator YesN/two-component system, NtrC family, C4-dicarboxylate transport response regulator DctD [Mariprofundus ferrinatatus]|uniref:Two-component system, NtrC family, response regulator PilR/two-component system, response regulator YesN/two-component system, NtrC family, C4-dicarboxylate transport response regulator DctD n=1 Tax=Mariprofundus ferrinatatus TaxID=1921087 RepID=A0A2K8L562_9PROT|nr:response regulator [Mariprofundus ferrinatatus]ATX82383.1 two-component system, NtrC family, response regulator PilR/two-component system, response regulator YesN/two-component system, NtrC family, C4-dicarboxylate transport response regulator DctD [Mariprofundus ferrinatatus]
MFHVVDDNEHVRELIVELLDVAGYGGKAFSCPFEYLDYVNSDSYISPVAIITDVRMPRMNGYELIEEVREKFPNQKFVVISGYEGKDGAVRTDPCHFLSKPFNPEQLIAVADAIVRCDM